MLDMILIFLENNSYVQNLRNMKILQTMFWIYILDHKLVMYTKYKNYNRFINPCDHYHYSQYQKKRENENVTFTQCKHQ